MSPARRRAALLVVVGLLLVANFVWLFPHEGELKYTYERVRIEVEDGELTYPTVFFAENYNDLNAVGCQPEDTRQRACAFDLHLVTHGPITFSEPEAHIPRRTLDKAPTFVQLHNGYYRRIHRFNNRSVTYDVERVTPRELLAAIAHNITGIQPGDLPEDAPWDTRLAVTGDTMTTFQAPEDKTFGIAEDGDYGRGPEDKDLGNVYQRNGTYYTVIANHTESVDHPLITKGSRVVIGFLGLGVLVVAITDLIEHRK